MVFSIVNTGDRTLKVEPQDLRLPFRSKGSRKVAYVPPRHALAFSVTFSPTATGRYDVVWKIETNDPTAPLYRVSLLGRGVR
jgi:hypothetical protein